MENLGWKPPSPPLPSIRGDTTTFPTTPPVQVVRGLLGGRWGLQASQAESYNANRLVIAWAAFQLKEIIPMLAHLKMSHLSIAFAVLVTGTGIVIGTGIALCEEAEDAAPQEKLERLSVPAARERAKLLYDVYSSTLDTLHHHYFHSNKAVLPARAMEDIFATLDENSKIKANWIAVNTNAMSVHHEPETKFEKKAARELSKGETHYEKIENGYLYRAGPISLGAGCVSCHSGFFSGKAKTPRIAGLVIGVPVQEEPAEK